LIRLTASACSTSMLIVESSVRLARAVCPGAH
jgi:hypothetical protein